MLEMLRKRMRDERGFTLIELMVVVLIIAILIAIAIPTFLGLRARAQDRAAQSNLRNGLTAGKAYFTDGQTYTGFDVAPVGGNMPAEDIEPALTWVAGATPGVNQVAIALANGNDVVLNGLSASTARFCIADSITGPGTVRGEFTDADAWPATFLACSAYADTDSW